MGDSIASECSPLLKMEDAQAKEGVQAQGNLRQRQQDRGTQQCPVIGPNTTLININAHSSD